MKKPRYSLYIEEKDEFVIVIVHVNGFCAWCRYYKDKTKVDILAEVDQYESTVEYAKEISKDEKYSYCY